jgi:hypothetical protein
MLARRILSNEKCIDNRPLNLMGLQVARTVAARTIKLARRATCISNQFGDALEDERFVSQSGNALAEKGFVSLDDWLMPKILTAVEQEARSLVAGGQEDAPDPSGVAATTLSFGKHFDAQDAPMIAAHVVGDSDAMRIIAAADGRSQARLSALSSPRFRIERTRKVREADAQFDEIKSVSNWHSDTYHSIYKGFLYLSDVTADTAPFTYVPGSHRWMGYHMRLQYRTSIGEHYKSPYPTRGEHERIDLAKREMVGGQNTLILADTFGLHRRGHFKKIGDERLIIHFDVRPKPFRF